MIPFKEQAHTNWIFFKIRGIIAHREEQGTVTLKCQFPIQLELFILASSIHFTSAQHGLIIPYT